MMTGRISNIACSLAAMLLGLVAAIATTGFHTAAAAAQDLHRHCRQVRNDDTLRDYSPALRDETIRSFKKLFPGARSIPADDEFATQAVFRCMHGKILVCFRGANLPCAKIDTSRDNPGANAYCRDNPNASFVPAVATGHDTVYSYRCHDGRPEIAGKVWSSTRAAMPASCGPSFRIGKGACQHASRDAAGARSDQRSTLPGPNGVPTPVRK